MYDCRDQWWEDRKSASIHYGVWVRYWGAQDKRKKLEIFMRKYTVVEGRSCCPPDPDNSAPRSHNRTWICSRRWLALASLSKPAKLLLKHQKDFFSWVNVLANLYLASTHWNRKLKRVKKSPPIHFCLLVCLLIGFPTPTVHSCTSTNISWWEVLLGHL